MNLYLPMSLLSPVTKTVQDSEHLLDVDEA